MNKTENITIVENVSLPSKGLIYENTPVIPEVQITSMNTMHEMRRLSHSDLPFRNMCEIIDECIVNDMGISCYDLCLGDYQYLLFKLRVATYGKDYAIVSTCPYCKSSNKSTVDIDTLPLKEYTEEFDNLRTFELPKSGKLIKIKYQTPRMIDNITDRVKEFKKKDQSGLDPTIMFTVAAMIEEIDHARPNLAFLDDWVKKLPMADTNTILAHADKLNMSIGYDHELENTCNICGLNYNTKLHTTNEFFRPALDI